MSDKFSNMVVNRKGDLGVNDWMQSCVINKPSINLGPVVSCIDINGNEKKIGINGVGILFKNCKIMRTGTCANYGTGGSNCVTGDPICFVEIISVFHHVFNNSKEGILAQHGQSCFVLPLSQISDAPDLFALMNEAYAQFVSQRKGDTKHDVTHIANGISSGLAAVCFSLCQEIVLNGNKPDTVRMKFLVEALYTLGITAHSVAKFSPECHKIFTLMPYVANTGDTFQSTLMSFIFDETPCDTIRVKHVGLSIFRYFKHSGWNTSYIDKTPVGLIGLLLIAPMLGGLITSELETVDIINQIIGSINDAITRISSEFAKTYFQVLSSPSGLTCNPNGDDVHVKNKKILIEFTKATKVPLVSLDQINLIYDAVLAKHDDIASAIGLTEHSEFVSHSTGFTINGICSNNFPVLIKSECKEKKCDYYIPSEPREWTGIGLKAGAEYIIKATPLGIANFKIGQTLGDHNVANLRFTAGLELIKGNYDGYAVTGMYYNSDSRKFIPVDAYKQSSIDPNKAFTVVSGLDGITVSQNGFCMLLIDNKGCKDLSPLLCFKYCTISIELVKIIPLVIVSPDKQNVQSNAPITTTESDINQCLSLKDSLRAFNITGSVRKTTYGQHSWGQSTANKLNNTVNSLNKY